MNKNIICVIFILLLFSVWHAPAKTLYTWTDKDGVVHITETKPPADATAAEKNNYRIKAKNEPGKTPDQRHKVQRKNRMQAYDAQKKAKRARREAGIARKAMADAIETANRMKAETDAYVEQWGVQARTRKSIRVKIDRKKDATNKAIAEAQRLTEIANRTEFKAREAEKQLAELNKPSDEIGKTTPAKPASQNE